jgi:hypothetical protein
MGLARPLLGHGPEVFTALFPRFESKELARAYPDFAHESPHNIFLDALVGQGIPGVAALLATCAAGVWWAWRSGNRWLAAALTAGIVSQQFTVFTVPTALLFYACLGMAASGDRSLNLTGDRAVWWITTAVGVLLVWAAWRYGAADYALERSRQDLARGDVRAAAAQYAAYDRRRLPGTSADLWYSKALAPQAPVQAGAAALRATVTSEDPFNAWYNLAVLTASRGDAAATETDLRAAIAAHPNWFKPHWTLAQVLRLESRLEEAEREAAIAADLNGGKNPEVARTLQEIRADRGGQFQK